jgi:hypothetical protein
MRKISLIFLLSVSSFAYSQTDLLNSDFQVGIPSNFTIVNNDGFTPDDQVAEYTSAWIAVVDPDNALDTVASSTSFFNPQGIASRWMITPALSVGSYGNFIEWNARSQDASFPDDYLILVSTTDNLLASFTDTIGYIMEENVDWTTRMVNLSEKGFTNQTLFIAFVNVSVDGYKLYVDDIHVWKEDPASIQEIAKENSIKVFPNPAREVVNIESDEAIEIVQLLNSNGLLLAQTNEKTISLLEFPAGIYFLKVKTVHAVKTIKVIKN